MRRLLLFVSALLALAGILAAPAAADDRSLCFNPSTAPDIAIEACGRLISSRQFKGVELSGAYNLRGLAYRKKGDYDRAIADATEAIRLDPKFSAAYYNRGVAYLLKGDYDRAIADFSEAIRLDPKYADRLHNRGVAYSNKGDYDRAIADYNEAIRLDPKYAVAYSNRGVAYRSKGDYDRAIADSSEAIRLDPKYAVAYINRGGAYSSKGDYDRAIADFNEAIRLDPKYAAAYFDRGRAYELKGDFANALSDFRSALGLAPSDTYVAEAVRRIERKLAARTEPKPPVSKPVEPPVVPGQPETRIALVIGNGSYANFGALANPGNDAKAIAAALNGIGFKTVTLLFDLPRERLLDALKTFAREAEKADWALIYFAGHGLELGGVNYLVPVDAKMSSDRDASFEAIELQKVLDAVGGAKKIGLVILDACRDNPFVKTMTRSMASTRSIGRGLAQIEPEGATLVAYAAKHGQVAEDGAGKNSPFVTALIKNLETPGLEINLLFRKVRDDVLAVTGRRQEPFVYSSLPGEALPFRKAVGCRREESHAAIAVICFRSAGARWHSRGTGRSRFCRGHETLRR